jgi:hypothetical protein
VAYFGKVWSVIFRRRPQGQVGESANQLGYILLVTHIENTLKQTLRKWRPAYEEIYGTAFLKTVNLKAKLCDLKTFHVASNPGTRFASGYCSSTLATYEPQINSYPRKKFVLQKPYA